MSIAFATRLKAWDAKSIKSFRERSPRHRNFTNISDLRLPNRHVGSPATDTTRLAHLHAFDFAFAGAPVTISDLSAAMLVRSH